MQKPVLNAVEGSDPTQGGSYRERLFTLQPILYTQAIKPFGSYSVLSTELKNEESC